MGLPDVATRRRTPGLRREDLAALAGVNIEYYTYLERGDERNPDPAAVDALADALQLDPEARADLRALTDFASDRQRTRPHNEPRVTPSQRSLLERLRPCPALLLARNSDVVTANPEDPQIYPGPDQRPRARCNTVRWVFLHPTAPDVLGDWDGAVRSSAANLRSRLAADPGAADIRGGSGRA